MNIKSLIDKQDKSTIKGTARAARLKRVRSGLVAIAIATIIVWIIGVFISVSDGDFFEPRQEPSEVR